MILALWIISIFIFKAFVWKFSKMNKPEANSCWESWYCRLSFLAYLHGFKIWVWKHILCRIFFFCFCVSSHSLSSVTLTLSLCGLGVDSSRSLQAPFLSPVTLIVMWSCCFRSCWRQGQFIIRARAWLCWPPSPPGTAAYQESQSQLVISLLSQVLVHLYSTVLDQPTRSGSRQAKIKVMIGCILSWRT